MVTSLSELKLDMKNIRHISTINEYNKIIGSKTPHPLVNVIDLSNHNPVGNWDYQIEAVSLGFFSVSLKGGKNCDILYGRNHYDYEEGTLVFMAPMQVVTIDVESYEPPTDRTSGHILLFHPDLLRGTLLGKHIQDYTFFGYQSNEALHLSEEERKIVLDCFAKIQYELQHAIDKHSKNLIVDNIELFLNYCLRFYDRQFITRDDVNRGGIERFENLLTEYYKTDKPQKIGIPSVAYCASELNLSANYFGDLIKKETGKSAMEFIHSKIIDMAKEKIFDSSKTISQVSYELGFKYPQHFTRLFRRHVGYSPGEFRTLN